MLSICRNGSSWKETDSSLTQVCALVCFLVNWKAFPRRPSKSTQPCWRELNLPQQKQQQSFNIESFTLSKCMCYNRLNKMNRQNVHILLVAFWRTLVKTTGCFQDKGMGRTISWPPRSPEFIPFGLVTSEGSRPTWRRKCIEYFHPAYSISIACCILRKGKAMKCSERKLYVWR